jgi:hypothetical protein
MSYTATTRDHWGTCLIDRVPEITLEAAKALFGVEPEDMGEAEKGYSWCFVLEDPDGNVVTLYDRYGVPRVGAHCFEAGERFVAFLRGSRHAQE